MGKNDGGPAFPTTIDLCDKGISIRDYFAAKAMQGLIIGEDDFEYDTIAKSSYKLADAMLAERNK